MKMQQLGEHILVSGTEFKGIQMDLLQLQVIVLIMQDLGSLEITVLIHLDGMVYGFTNIQKVTFQRMEMPIR